MEFDTDPRRRFRHSDEGGDIPSSPPACVLAEVDAAFARMQRLRAAGREVHFARDAARGRLVIELRTLAGDVLDTLSPSAALELLTEGDA